MALVLALAWTCSSTGAIALSSPIPYQTLPGGGKLPLLIMGDGVNWGRGTNWTQWIDLVGAGAGIDSAWDYGSEPAIPPAIAKSKFSREDIFITSKIPCDHWDGGVEPMNRTQAEWYIARDLAELNTSYVDLMLLHHICATPAETIEVWKALEGMKQRGQARAIGVSNFE
jgi:diketogulonate reductase-like aldo/keto reductase